MNQRIGTYNAQLHALVYSSFAVVLIFWFAANAYRLHHGFDGKLLDLPVPVCAYLGGITALDVFQQIKQGPESNQMPSA